MGFVKRVFADRLRWNVFALPAVLYIQTGISAAPETEHPRRHLLFSSANPYISMHNCAPTCAFEPQKQPEIRDSCKKFQNILNFFP